MRGIEHRDASQHQATNTSLARLQDTSVLSIVNKLNNILIDLSEIG